MTTTNLLDAIHVACENERIACESYANASKGLTNPLAKELFERLSEFEQYHFDRLTALEKSLKEGNDYIDYAGKEFPLPPIFEIPAAQEPQQKSVMKIISEARQLERQAQQAYADLANQIEDPQGQAMFKRLAEEEDIHYRILTEVYWNLNDRGIWKWSHP